MNDTKPNEIVVRQIRELRKRRTEILSLPPEEMVDEILSEKNPAPLVHSFPEEDFYFMVHEIGPEDALPLLSLASNRQMSFLLDQEVWGKDRINLATSSQWVQYMLEADASRFTKWLMHEKTDLLEYFLHYTVELKIREHDQDPSDFGEGFHSFDNVFYFRIIDPVPHEKEDMELDSGDEEKISPYKEQIHKLLEEMANEDHVFYQKVLLEATHLLPAEAEEEAYRWRNVRLSEKGFLPFDEAIGIYQPLTIDQVNNLKRKFKVNRNSDDPVMTTPESPFDLLKKQKLYSQALVANNSEEELRRLQEEFAVLCNQIIVADQANVKNRNDLAVIVKKVCGYIQIGLEKISLLETGIPLSNLMLTYPLSSLFSFGFGCALNIKWRAEKWLNDSWFKSQKLPLSFWGEAWLGVLGGVLIKKPLYFDNYHGGVLYREFETLSEVDETNDIINDIIITDKLLALINISPGKEVTDKKRQGFISFKNYILTLWARHYLALPETVTPIIVKEFEAFYEALWDKSKTPIKISGTLKTGCLEYLSHKTGLKTYEISDEMGHILECLFAEIEEEYGAVSFGNIQPEYVHHFLLK